MILLAAKHLSLSFGASCILSDASLSLASGERAALCGPNGAGKTTLLNLLSGALTPDEGDVFQAAGTTLGVLSQHALEHSQNTVFGEALLACPALLELEERISREETRLQSGDARAANALTDLHERFSREGGQSYRARVKSALCAVGLSEHLDRSVQTLSGGQKTTLALVKLLFSEPDILLLDEPTNHLDLRALLWLENTLLSLKSALLVVSHDRYFLDRVTTKTIDLEHGKTESYPLAYSEFREAKKEKRLIEEKHYELQQREIRRQEGIIAQQRQFNRERNIIAAESREKALLRMKKLDKPLAGTTPPRFTFQSLPSPHDVLRASHLSFSYGQRPILRDFSLEVFAHDRLFFAGEVGSGKSTVLKLLCGALAPDAGSVSPGVGIRIGYYDQENQNLTPSNTVFSELFSSDAEQNEGALRSYLAAFRFTGDKVFQRVDSLSGGERARLSLAKLMRTKCNLLFLDEPTNHLDMDSKEALEEALLAYPGTAIVVSHDRYFLSRCATKLFYFESGKQPLFLPGGAARLSEFYQSFGFGSSNTKKQSAGKDAYLQKKKEDAAARKKENDLKHTRIAIEETEAALEQAAAQIALYADDYKKLEELYAKRDALEQKLEALYETLFALQE